MAERPAGVQDARTDDDADAVARFRAGEQAAFAEIVRRHQESIRRLVARYVHNDADAKDLAQQAFTRAFEKLADFRGESTFRAWLFRIAVNLALNHVRGNPPRPLEPLEDVASFTHSLQTSRLVAAELWRKVALRLAQLPPKQRLVLELRIFHDLSFAEVSALADCTEDTAKVHFHYAIKRLRDLLPQ
jgi:RNA polymerase sigma-70 factor (ECF subfamily)